MVKWLGGLPILMGEAGLGLGAMYSLDKPDDPYDNLIPKKHETDQSVQFALKLSLGCTFYVTPIFGIGAHFDYALGLHRWKADPEDYDAWEGDPSWQTHNILMGFHFNLRLF